MGFARERMFAIVDIESGSVKIACVSLPASGPATIIAQDHSTISLEERTEKQQAAWIGTQVAEIGARVLEKMSQKGVSARMEAVYCVLHVPFVHSAAGRSSATYEADSYISDATIESLAKDALAAQKDIDMSRLLESSVTRVSLNGYPTAKPVGKYARSIEVSTIATECDVAIREKVEEAVRASFPAAKIVWRSSVRATQAVLRSIQTKISDYVLVGVGTDAAHVSTIRDGVLCAQGTVSEGLRTILARAGGGHSADEVFGLIRMLGRGAAASEASTNIQASLATIEPDLVRSFGETMALIASPLRLPGTLVLATHPDMSDWLSGFFSRIDFTQFTLTAMPFSVVQLDAPSFSQLVAHGEQSDVSILIAASLVNIETRS